MKKTSRSAAPSPTKAAGGARTAIAGPSKSKVGDAGASPTKSKAVAPEAAGPSAMDLLEIARCFELITPDQMRGPNVPEDAESVTAMVPRGSDGVFRSSLEEAAHLYSLADSVAKRCRDGDPFLLRKLHDAEQERARQLERIWACAKSGELLSTEQAYKKFGFKTYAPLSKSLREFGCRHREGDDISAEVVRVLKILRKNQDRQTNTAQRKLTRDALKAGAGTGGSVDSTMPARSKADRDAAYRNLLGALKEGFETAGISVESSRFFEIFFSDI